MSTPEPVAVRCRGLVKRYGDLVAVAGIDLEIRAGECFGLLGPNGAGKTTTVKMLEGLMAPDSGSVEILGRDWRRHRRELLEAIGVQMQETRLSEKLTVEETLRLFRSFYHSGPTVAELLASVGLSEKRSARVGTLSGGQHQRLSIACALAGDPRVLFLDEPTTGLDPQARRRLWEVLESLEQRGVTILLTTHAMEEAERLCDRVAIVDRGRIIACDTPAALIATLGAEHVVAFEGDGRLVAADLARLPAVADVARAEEAFRLTVTELHRALPALVDLLAERGFRLSRLTTHHATLEDVFVRLTGRALRD